MRKTIFIAFMLLIALSLFSFTLDAAEIPLNLQKVAEYNRQQAEFYSSNLTLVIAFLAGILTILTPCSLAILPAFFAYTFREKKEITKMTLTFFAGFTPVFVAFGITATLFGKSISLFRENSRFFVALAGFLIIFLGIMALFGKGFSGIKLRRESLKNKGMSGIFFFGVLFALGFSACMGPILVGILLIASVFNSYLYAGVLMFFYSFGLFVPLFLISMFFDKYNFPGYVSRINKKLGFSVANVLSSIFLISIGMVFIIYGNTSITGSLGLGELTRAIYSIQNVIVSKRIFNSIGILILAGFLFLLWKSLVKYKNAENGRKRKIKEDA